MRAFSSGFGRALLALTCLAFVIRLVFALTVASDLRFGVDADYYRYTATSLAEGRGFTWRPADSPWNKAAPPSLRIPSTEHGPIPALVLAGGNLLGLDTWDQHRMLLSLVASIGVGLTGLLGRRIGGPAVGLVAAGIVAVHPLLLQTPGFLTAEAAYLTVVTGMLLVAHVAVERKTLPWIAATGAMCAIAALTRSEAALFVGFLAVPVAILAGPGRRARSLATALVVPLLVVAPWLGWMRAHSGVLTLSTNGGKTFAGSNCEAAYYGPLLGSFAGDCALGAGGVARWSVPPGTDDARAAGMVDQATRRMAMDYVKTQKSRLPVLVAARIGRTLGVFRVSTSLEFDEGIGAHPATQRVGYGVNLLLMPLALGGVVLLARRREVDDLVVLLAGPLVAISTGVLVYGAARMRVAAEPAIAILAASALVSLVSWARSRRDAPAAQPSERPEPSEDERVPVADHQVEVTG